ncbi:MAG TPA: lipocalin-like domain-containing protein [Candidatus Acidoferrales bacterium]|nr:lipocalin-like domain-containing protein [Candidatus Acidoferrales bacterium]
MNDATARGSSVEVRARLIGTWRLVSFHEELSDGEIVSPTEDQGQLIYTAEGRMSAQLMQSNRARFGKGDWREATDEERARAWLEYFGYYGTFSIDEEKKAVIHHVEGSSFPNLVGSKQVRYFRFEGKCLVLNADSGWGKVRAVWEKVGSSNF